MISLLVTQQESDYFLVLAELPNELNGWRVSLNSEALAPLFLDWFQRGVSLGPFPVQVLMPPLSNSCSRLAA